MPTTVLFLTDSLGYAREDEGLVPDLLYTNLFPEDASTVEVSDARDRLGLRSFCLSRRSARLDVSQVSNGHWDTRAVLEHVRGRPPGAAPPDLAVLHVGVVDCSPRLLRRGTQQWLARRALLAPAWRFAARRFRRQLLPLGERLRGGRTVYVLPGEFRANLESTADELGAGRLGLLSIVRASDTGTWRSPGWNEQIDAYNLILEGLARSRDGVDFLDLNAHLDPAADVSGDGFHLTAHGHEVARGVLREWALAHGAGRQARGAPGAAGL